MATRSAAQHHDEGREAPAAAVFGIAVVQQGQEVHENHRRRGADEDEGRPAAQLLIAAAVRQRPEEGQQEEGQDIVQRHHRARQGLVHVEGLPQDQGDDIVVHLPEGADGEEGQAHQDRPFVVELHKGFPRFLCSWVPTGEKALPGGPGEAGGFKYEVHYIVSERKMHELFRRRPTSRGKAAGREPPAAEMAGKGKNFPVFVKI